MWKKLSQKSLLIPNPGKGEKWGEEDEALSNEMPLSQGKDRGPEGNGLCPCGPSLLLGPLGGSQEQAPEDLDTAGTPGTKPSSRELLTSLESLHQPLQDSLGTGGLPTLGPI